MRYQALMLSGMLMGIGGAFLSMAQFNAFTFGVISGRGWVCIALVVFGQWGPWKCLAGALLFGFVDALQLRLQASGVIDVPYQLFLMLPFVLTIVAMAAVSRSATAAGGAAQAVPQRGALMLDLVVRNANLPDGRTGSTSPSPTAGSSRWRPASTPRRRARSTPPAAWSRRRSSTATSTSTPP